MPGGTCHLYLKHTTAALTVMTWEAGVPEDIMDILQSLTPKLAFRLLNMAYHVFPDSAAAKGQATEGCTRESEQIMLAKVFKGVHW